MAAVMSGKGGAGSKSKASRLNWNNWLGIAAVVPVALLIGAVAVHCIDLLLSEQHREEVVRLFTDINYYRILLNTAGYALLATFIAMLYGLPIAWFTERIARKGARWIRIAMIAGTIVPGFFVAMGWLLLGHPRIGFFAGLGIPVNITSLTGLAFAQGLALASLVFVMIAPSMAALSDSLEESAAIHGMRRRAILWNVWLPLLKPALLACGSVVFLISFASFDIPAVLGLSNRIVLYSTFIYELITPASGVPQYGLAAASSVPVLVMAVVLTLVYLRLTKAADAYAIVGGKARGSGSKRPLRITLWVGWAFCLFYLLASIVLPLLAVGWASLLPFYRPPSLQAISNVSLSQYQELFSSQFLSSAGNTVIFALVAPTITVALGFVICWAGARAVNGVRYALDVVSFLPLAIPSAVLAVGAVALALMLGSVIPIYGTLALIIIVEAVARIPIATRAIGSALLQLNKELDEAGAVFGLGIGSRVFKITLPLIFPAMLYVWFLLAILAFRELAIPVLLASKGNITISVYTFGLLSTGSFGRAAALTLVVLAIVLTLALLALLVHRLLRRARLVRG